MAFVPTFTLLLSNMSFKYCEGIVDDRLCEPFTQVCFVNEYVMASGVDNILRLWQFKTRQLLRWQCPYKITSIAITDTQIAVATSMSNVYILDYNITNSNLRVQQKINILLPIKKKSSIYQLRLLNDRDGYRMCLIFRRAEVYLCEWNIATVGSEINEDSGNDSMNVAVPGAFSQSIENGTLHKIIKDPNFYFDAIEIIKDDLTYWLLVGINEKRDSVSVKLLSQASNKEKSQWSYKNKDAEFHLFDISRNGWILLQDILKGQTLLVNIFSGEICSEAHNFTSGCFLKTSSTEAYFVSESTDSPALRIYNQKFKCLQTWSNEMNYKPNCKELGFARSIATSQNNVAKIWNDKTRKHSSILIFIEDNQNQSRFDCDLVDRYEKYYQPPCLQNQSKILDSTCLSNNAKIEALLVQENSNQYIYRWISESESFCLQASLQIQSDNGEIYTRVIIQRSIIVICSEFVNNFVAVQIWRRRKSVFMKGQTNWTRFSQKGKVIKLISLDMSRFCLATDTELKIFDDNVNTTNTIAIDRNYILEDIVYDVDLQRLIAVYSKNEFVRQIIITNEIESDLKVEIRGLRQVILDSSGRWCSFNNESVLQVFEENNQLAKVKLENDGQLCSFAKDGEVIVAVAKADGNILGYFPLGSNNEKDTTQLDSMWQVGCGQSDDETRWKVHDFRNRVFHVQNEDTFSVCNKYKDERQILFGYNRCALAN